MGWQAYTTPIRVQCRVCSKPFTEDEQSYEREQDYTRVFTIDRLHNNNFAAR